MLSLFLFVALSCSSTLAQAVSGAAFGFGQGATGGGDAPTQTPSSIQELEDWLADATPRTIVLDKIMDFSDRDGETTGEICYPWSCSPSPQLAIETSFGWCDPSYKRGTATWKTTAAAHSLSVGSNKSLIGSGKTTGIKGIGLDLRGVENVIIQNIAITDLNPQFVWGGDAISIRGGKKIWFDRNYINRIGRQMIVTHDDPSEITVSNNIFDGESEWSASCNGQHYWVALFNGKKLDGETDKITFAYNHLSKTSGRGPKANDNQLMHIVNNVFSDIDGHALETPVGSNVFAEGNYFTNVKSSSSDEAGTLEYFVQADIVDACSSALGRPCQANELVSSGAVEGHTAEATLARAKSEPAITDFQVKTAQEAFDQVSKGTSGTSAASQSVEETGAGQPILESTADEADVQEAVVVEEESVTEPTPEVAAPQEDAEPAPIAKEEASQEDVPEPAPAAPIASVPGESYSDYNSCMRSYNKCRDDHQLARDFSSVRACR